MSAYDLEEQEQLAALKAWWKQHGGSVLTGAVLVLLAVAAWSGWNWYQRNQVAGAGTLYETLQKAARTNDVKATRDAAGTILENYPRTIYAPLAALVSAKVHFQSGDLKTAKAQLAWAVEHAKSDELRAIARLRLAAVLLDEGSAEEALKTLEAKPGPAFQSLFDSLRGDILLAQKKQVEARAAYKSALEKSDANDGALRESLRIRLDALGEGDVEQKS
jgi:predicted negative regulator of RcsB-dependent stress response